MPSYQGTNKPMQLLPTSLLIELAEGAAMPVMSTAPTLL